MDDPTIEPPNDAEAEWVRTNVMGVREAAGGRQPPRRSTSSTPAGSRSGRPSPRRMGGSEPDDQRLRAGVRQVLVDELGLDWAVVTDKHGTEIAVHGQPGDLLVFPPNLVAKRFERGETHFWSRSTTGSPSRRPSSDQQTARNADEPHLTVEPGTFWGFP